MTEQVTAERAALICYRCTGTGPVTAEWTYWDNRGQARQAQAELADPCGQLCIGIHSVVRIKLERRPTTPSPGQVET